MAVVSRAIEGVLYTSQMPQTSLRETIRRLGRVHNMHADAAESRFPPDKAERALWGLSPMSERERRLAKNGDGPTGCSLCKGRSNGFWEMPLRIFGFCTGNNGVGRHGVNRP